MFATGAATGPRNYLSLLVNRARMEGMVVFDHAARYPQAVAELAGYLKDGRMTSREDVVDAIAGNICRCTGYEPIVQAILTAARANSVNAA